MINLSPDNNGGVNNSDKPKQNRPRKRRVTKSAKASTVSPDAVQTVWDYWVLVMGSSRAVLDDDRKLSIGAAIHDYGIDGCRKAIDGCAVSPFHMGANQAQKKYNGIDLIFRNSEKTESFIQRTETRDPRQEFLDESG